MILKLLFKSLIGFFFLVLESIGYLKSLTKNFYTIVFSHPRILVAFLIVGFGGACVIATLLFTGPHMTYQQKYLAFQSILPGIPDNAVPVEKDPRWVNHGIYRPVAPTKDNLQNGKRTYELYCIFCHGRRHDGNGPVGVSYVPKPANYHSPDVLALSDSAMYNKMLYTKAMQIRLKDDTIPIFPRLIPPQYRWYLIAYVKSLKVTGAGGGEAKRSALVTGLKPGPIDQALVEKGKGIFEKNCSVCHAMNTVKTGPPLGDVTKARSADFIMNMILNPTYMESNNQTVKELVNRFKMKMPDTGLDSTEARSVLEYLRTQSGSGG